MRLLVSVRDAEEARAALAGGAEIVDAKEPARGALGAVDVSVLREIQATVGAVCPTSAALGDATDVRAIERAAHEAATLELAYVKIGFRGITRPACVRELVAAAVRGARAAGTGTAVIAVAYADADAAHVESVPPDALVDAAARAGAHGVLLDTARKTGGGVLALMTPEAIARWVRAAHEASLVAALAGKLAERDVATVQGLGADVIGVRGAACDGGREGRVSVHRVRAMAAAVHAEPRAMGSGSLGGHRGSLTPLPPR